MRASGCKRRCSRRSVALNRAEGPDRSLAWGWRWVLGLAAATAVVVIVAFSIFHAPNAPVIQLAMLDTVGGTRGTDMNEMATLQGTWKESPVQHFSSASELEAWEKNWPNGDGRPAAKIIYDAAAGEVRVSGRSRGEVFPKDFSRRERFGDDVATSKRVRSGTNEKVNQTG